MTGSLSIGAILRNEGSWNLKSSRSTFAALGGSVMSLTGRGEASCVTETLVWSVDIGKMPSRRATRASVCSIPVACCKEKTLEFQDDRRRARATVVAGVAASRGVTYLSPGLQT